MLLTAAPILRKAQSDIGAPGMTDFVRIYIASELNKPEYRTTLRHEQAHVWAGHNRRRPKKVNSKLWTIACEMEIARTIYDAEDVANINAPRSRLAGGFLADTLEGLPTEAFLAEDIYAWLLKQPEKDLPEANCMCSCNGESNAENDLDNNANPPSDIFSARKKLDENEIVEKSQIAAIAAYKAIHNRPPSLTEAVDSALRIRIERERSYRRPARRHDHAIILSGKASTPRPPLVEIFVDRSGSFSADKTAQAELNLTKLLTRYGASIKSDVWYFGNGKLIATDPGGGGDTPYHLISQHLTISTPKLAIIITDDDPVDSSVTNTLGVNVICVPIGCASTKLSLALRGKDVR